ncbi:MAG: HAD-IC family P-type ATPase, partial [Candidatus Moranbacteria bacterium]|nr:HAD-IC family P-type ATPase [Candidatus Moranbacteria bacterium]
DTLHEEAKGVLEFLRKNKVEVRMFTGDHRAIGERIGKELGLKKSQIFSEILPKDKYELINEAKKKHVVAATGDGVNDLPAIKSANVGIAVSNAVDALKSSADIVLLNSSIAVIKDAIIEARKIFSRVYSYSVYRISESFRLIITIAILGIVYKTYPLTPIQLIILALLNDIPIISLAFNRVKAASIPAKIDVRGRFILSSLFGLVGVVNSLLLFAIMTQFLHLDWNDIQTIFFLKLAVSGHLLIYVAHTEERWYKFLPSKEVILATLATQLIATFMAYEGIFVNKISVNWIIFVWIWAIFWMQVGELVKVFVKKFIKK